MEIKEITNIISNKKLYELSKEELTQYVKTNIEFQKSLTKICMDLKIYGDNNIKKRINIINSFNYDLKNFEDVKIFINKFLIKSKNFVSATVVGFYIKIRPELREKILEITNFYPKKITLAGRCKLILKDIKIFPLCKHCNEKQALFTKDLKLSEFCSKKCSDNSTIKLDKMKQTRIERYGDGNYVNHAKRKETNKKIHGDENYSNREKAAETSMKLYGTKQYNNREKAKKTSMEKYGEEYYARTSEYVEKSKETCLSKYSVEFPMQNMDFFKKSQKSALKIKTYKNTNLTYQGTYELYFLEEVEKNELLNKVNHSKSFEYFFEGKKHVYFPDYTFFNKIIEIKSTWTYNKNGTDLELQKINEAKWQAVRDCGKEIIILFSKEEIKNYVSSLII